MKENYKAFDVVYVDFGKVEFAGEQGGIRPAVIVQNSMGNLHSSTTIVIPFTTKIKHLNQPTHSLIKKGKEKGIMVDSMLLGECLRQVSEKRIKEKIGHLYSLEDKKKTKMVYDANFASGWE